MKDDDKRLIGLLSKDSRMSNVEIAKRMGITEGAVRARIKRLVRSGTIRRFTVELSEGPANYGLIMVKSKGDTKRMMSAIAALGLHKDAYEISGQYDGCVIVQGDSLEEIDKKIDKIRKIKGVADTRTYLSFRRY